MSIRGYSFVLALRKCSKAAFGEQNKMKGIYGDCLVFSGRRKAPTV